MVVNENNWPWLPYSEVLSHTRPGLVLPLHAEHPDLIGRWRGRDRKWRDSHCIFSHRILKHLTVFKIPHLFLVSVALSDSLSNFFCFGEKLGASSMNRIKIVSKLRSLLETRTIIFVAHSKLCCFEYTNHYWYIALLYTGVYILFLLYVLVNHAWSYFHCRPAQRH